MYDAKLIKAQPIATPIDNNLDPNNLEDKLQDKLQHIISSFELELTQSQQKALTKLWQFIHSSEHFFSPGWLCRNGQIHHCFCCY